MDEKLEHGSQDKNCKGPSVMTKSFTSFVSRETQSKITLMYSFSAGRLAKMQ